MVSQGNDISDIGLGNDISDIGLGLGALKIEHLTY